MQEDIRWKKVNMNEDLVKVDDRLSEEETGGSDEMGKGVAADNRGIGVVEIILILVVLIGLVLIFQTQIRDIVSNALGDISNGAKKITI